MKLSEKLKHYILEIVRDESEELKKRESLLEENVRNLNATVTGYEMVAENVRNLNAAVIGYEVVAENVRNLNAVVAGYEELVENVRNLNAAAAGYEELAENVRNLNAAAVGYEELAENVRNLNAAAAGYEELAENVRNLNATAAGYEELAENVRNLNAAAAGYEELAENVRNLNAAAAGYEELAENVRNLNVAVEGQEAIVENVRNLNRMAQDYGGVIENIRNNNSMIEILNTEVKMQKVKIALLEKSNKNIQDKAQTVSDNNIVEMSHGCSKLEEKVYSGIDYFDFENHFRGSMQHIRETQKPYVKYFKGYKNVVDLGCGRGEFLELLQENGIEAQGVDLYEEFVEMCRLKQLNAVQADAIEFLKKQQKVGGIFASQLIEHLSISQIVMLCELAYNKLEDGAYLILETPNPQSLSIYTNSFYIDPSHDKPVHPLTLQYILQKAGFKDIEIIYTDASRPQIAIPLIEQENMEEFNAAMKQIENILFGSQDYAMIARKI